MSNNKITPHQMRKNLAYVKEGGPDFMRMLTGQSSSAANNDPRNPYRKPIGIEAKFQSDQPSDDDDGETAHDILNEREEERPTVVVLKDGKHLDERQVKNILNNLPAGLSQAEIEKRLASGAGVGSDSKDNKNNEYENEDEEEDGQDPIDANGKILFRKPKGVKFKSKSTATMSINSSASKKNFETAILAEAEAKVQALKKKQSASKSLGQGTETTTISDSSKRKADNGSGPNISKKKRPQKKNTTSLLSFNEDE
ncbi:hypothetical protein FBU30_010970 [Linnemannia zychae]|nr:hypothetical protein FBU30_010970 [Linnemannia zychae]